MNDYIIIQFGNGQETIIDLADSDLSKHKWRAQKSKRGYYAARWEKPETGTRRYIYLHRVILSRILGRELGQGDWTDHEDLDKLNNRRSNLRLANVSENNRNVGISRNNTSGYKGVSWNKEQKKYEAYIWKDRKKIRLGLFDRAEDAHKAYCSAAIKYHGKFARS